MDRRARDEDHRGDTSRLMPVALLPPSSGLDGHIGLLGEGSTHILMLESRSARACIVPTNHDTKCCMTCTDIHTCQQGICTVHDPSILCHVVGCANTQSVFTSIRLTRFHGSRKENRMYLSWLPRPTVWQHQFCQSRIGSVRVGHGWTESA